ncbi:hypothetical protein Ancab_020191, partial [Ancistrocladus abbreviatus]
PSVSSSAASRGNKLSVFFVSPHVTESNPQSKSASNAEIHQNPLDKFLRIDCKSGNITIHESKRFFDDMLHMQPTPPISYFNYLLGATVKRKHYNDVIWFYKRMKL